MRYSKNELEKQAGPVFEQEKVDTLFATTDGQFFLKKHFADAHADKMKLTVYPLEKGKKGTLVKHIVSQEDLDNNPELAAAGVNIGDEIELPAEEDAKKEKPAPVKELIANIASITDIEELNRLLSEERARANRVSAVKALEERISKITAQ